MHRTGQFGTLARRNSQQGGAGGRGPAEKQNHMLRRKLEEAVAAEQFEEAARLRDEIRRLSEQSKTVERSR